ncbi:MAG: ribonuclease HII [Deltaproteobacteria bacterium]|nr:ribonuclease HII [Deltaproteobacteria bacterium]MBW2018963.1 ribonuclease HII [Deltaproteobacteria bacterium]MBW2073553.1 ribonuclease HII [Deltaproteobacteria bacterium]RLB82729.1 MAG: ribonuclease HII [Deltaproteobacteria bacterium]
MDIDRELFEKKARQHGYSKIAGIDEAGRGPLAGPVVAAAAILPQEFDLPYLDDSKRLSPKRREELFSAIYKQAISIGIGIVDPVEIDRINILQASLLSMRMAVDNLRPAPDYLLVDGTFTIRSPVPQQAIKHGDRRCLSIAAASIIAKVTRDRLMGLYDEEFPEFGFGKNKGYGTEEHRAAIRTFGYCWIHRKTFRGVREYVKGLL